MTAATGGTAATGLMAAMAAAPGTATSAAFLFALFASGKIPRRSQYPDLLETNLLAYRRYVELAVHSF